MRITQLALSVLAAAAVATAAPPAAAEPLLCVYTEPVTIHERTLRPVEVCVL